MEAVGVVFAEAFDEDVLQGADEGVVAGGGDAVDGFQ